MASEIELSRILLTLIYLIEIATFLQKNCNYYVFVVGEWLIYIYIWIYSSLNYTTRGQRFSVSLCLCLCLSLYIYIYVCVCMYVFVPGKPFQPSLLFAGNSGAYPSEAPFRCSTIGQAPSLSHRNRLGWRGLPGTNIYISDICPIYIYIYIYIYIQRERERERIFDRQFVIFKELFFLKTALWFGWGPFRAELTFQNLAGLQTLATFYTLHYFYTNTFKMNYPYMLRSSQTCAIRASTLVYHFRPLVCYLMGLHYKGSNSHVLCNL